MKKIALTVLFSVIASSAGAQFPPEPDLGDFQLEQPPQEFDLLELDRWPVPYQAASVAWVDAQAAGINAIYFRYVWLPDRSLETANIVDLSINMALSRATIPIKGVRLGGGLVLRYDLRHLAVKVENLQLLVDLWERFSQTEPYFSINGPEVTVRPTRLVFEVTKRGAVVQIGERTLGRVDIGTKLAILGEQDYQSVKWYSVQLKDEIGYIQATYGEPKEEEDKEKKQRLRTFGPHVGDESTGLLLACKSAVPIVRYDYFLYRVLSTLNGGLYYEFRGIVPAPEGSGISDIDNFLRTFAGVTELDIAKLRSDKKVAMFRSQITGRQRAVVLFSGPQAPININQGLIAITQDGSDGDVDPAADPLLNLIKAKFVAVEVFVEMPNGQIAYSLFAGDFDGDGKYDPKVKNGAGVAEGSLQRSAPDNVAKDHTVPIPHTARLQPAISCIRCHITKRDGKEVDGWISLPNDVQRMLKDKLDVFGEASDKSPDLDTLFRLAGLYAGDLSKPIIRARDDLAEATTRITGEVDGDVEGVVTKLHNRIGEHYNKYYYDLVTPQIACQELGFKTPDDKTAVKALQELLGALPPDKIGISPEDPRLGALKVGIGINRLQWEQVYADAALRSIEALRNRRKK